jgi:hypothetical protein
LVNSRIRLLQDRLAAERGSVIMEALVGAVLVAVMAVAFFGALDGSNRVSGVAKLRAQAAALASDDQERLRSMPVASLNEYHQSVTKNVAGLNFVVDSKADWIADKTKDQTCTGNGAAADYLRITSTVTPTNNTALRPVAISSTVTPAPGSFNGKGSLAVTVVDRNGAGVADVAVQVSGPANGSAFTDASGCAFLGYLPAGTTYTVAIAKPNYVDQDGDDTPSVTGFTINDQQVATQGFTYDLAGSAAISFSSQPIFANGSSRGDTPSSQWKVNVYNSNHAWLAGVAYPTTVPGSSPWPSTGAQPSFAVDKLFPFTSTYGVYPGDNCTKNDPANNGVTVPGLQIQPGVLGTPYNVQLPALNVYGTTSGSPAANLRVKITHTTSGCGNWSIVRQTNAAGLLDDPGVPFGTYSVCVDNAPIVGSTNARHAGPTTITAASLPGTGLQTFPIPTNTGSGKC